MGTGTRLIVGIALLAAGSASAAPPPSSPSTGSALEGLEVGGLVGYEADTVSGLSLRVDGALPFRDLSPQVKLSLVGSLGYSRLSEGVLYGDFTSNVFKIVPAARLSVPLNPRLSLFGDVGVGLAFVSAKVETNVPFLGRSSSSASTVNLMMRFGAGTWYRVSPKLALGAMLELDPIHGDYGFSGRPSQTTFLVMGGAMYRL